MFESWLDFLSTGFKSPVWYRSVYLLIFFTLSAVVLGALLERYFRISSRIYNFLAATGRNILGCLHWIFIEGLWVFICGSCS